MTVPGATSLTALPPADLPRGCTTPCSSERLTLDRQVALTFVVQGVLPDVTLKETHAVGSAGVRQSGIARCDVVHTQVDDLWSRSGSAVRYDRRHLTNRRLAPSGRAVPGRGRRCCPPRRCCALSISHRVSIDGDSRAGLPRPAGTPTEDDPRRRLLPFAGRRWPLPEAGVQRLAPPSTFPQQPSKLDIDRDIPSRFPRWQPSRRDTQRVNAVESNAAGDRGGGRTGCCGPIDSYRSPRPPRTSALNSENPTPAAVATC